MDKPLTFTPITTLLSPNPPRYESCIIPIGKTEPNPAPRKRKSKKACETSNT